MVNYVHKLFSSCAKLCEQKQWLPCPFSLVRNLSFQSSLMILTRHAKSVCGGQCLYLTPCRSYFNGVVARLHCHRHADCDSDPIDTTILRVCHQLHDEGRTTLYRSNTFSFEFPDVMSQFLERDPTTVEICRIRLGIHAEFLGPTKGWIAVLSSLPTKMPKLQQLHIDLAHGIKRFETGLSANRIDAFTQILLRLKSLPSRNVIVLYGLKYPIMLKEAIRANGGTLHGLEDSLLVWTHDYNQERWKQWSQYVRDILLHRVGESEEEGKIFGTSSLSCSDLIDDSHKKPEAKGVH